MEVFMELNTSEIKRDIFKLFEIVGSLFNNYYIYANNINETELKEIKKELENIKNIIEELENI